MLVLKRYVGESIIIEGGIRVLVLEVGRNHVALGVEAPHHVGIDREEVVERKRRWRQEEHEAP